MTWGDSGWAAAGIVVLLLAVVLIFAGYRHRSRWRRAARGAMFDRFLPPSVRLRRAVRDVTRLGLPD